jgi:hypothetical protein
LEPAQYLESAAQGLGFFHVEVLDDTNRGGYLIFLDNYLMLSVEEGLIDKAEIVENLKKLFDHNWHWQLKEIDEFRYLVRFPPHKQVDTGLTLSSFRSFVLGPSFLLNIKRDDQVQNRHVHH